MREIRELDGSYIHEYAEIAYNAYPSFKDFGKEAMAKYEKETLKILEEDSDVTFYGMFDEEKLIGVMRLFDFKMNCFGKIIPASGIGFLGVHLMHKKEKVARDMLKFYEKHYLEKNIPIGTLLPFRPDFYKKMGYGMGTKMNQYRIPAGRIKPYYGDSNIKYIREEDLDKLLECHDRVVNKTHGMIKKIGDEKKGIFSDNSNSVVGNYDENGNINGYMVYKFQNGKTGNYTVNNIYMKEFVYENADVLNKLLGFLRKQEDQVNLVIFNSEDEYFYYLFDDPRNDSLNYIPYGYLETNTQAVGVMYKIFDIKEAFLKCSHRNYNNSNLGVKFVVKNDFFKKEDEIIINFNNGIIDFTKKTYDVIAKMNISDFSSLFMGSAGAKGLFELGLLKVDDELYLENLDLTFYCSQKPVCYTNF